MLEVHIPSVGPEDPRQSPEKGHMVSGDTGWEGARDPPDFPAPSAVGIPRPGCSIGARRVRPSGDRLPRVSGRLDLPAPWTTVRVHEGLHGAEGRARPPHLPKCVGSVGGSPETGGAPRPLCAFERGRAGALRARVLLSPPAGPHAHLAARPRPPGVPSGSAVPRAQAHRAEALQRVPRAAQAGEAAPPTDRPTPARLLPSSWETGELRAQPLPPLPPQSLEGSGPGHRPPCGLRGGCRGGRAQPVLSMPSRGRPALGRLGGGCWGLSRPRPNHPLASVCPRVEPEVWRWGRGGLGETVGRSELEDSIGIL